MATGWAQTSWSAMPELWYVAAGVFTAWTPMISFYRMHTLSADKLANLHSRVCSEPSSSWMLLLQIEKLAKKDETRAERMMMKRKKLLILAWEISVAVGSWKLAHQSWLIMKKTIQKTTTEILMGDERCDDKTSCRDRQRERPTYLSLYIYIYTHSYV